MRIGSNPRFASVYPVTIHTDDKARPKPLQWVVDQASACVAAESARLSLGAQQAALISLPDCLAKAVERGAPREQLSAIMIGLPTWPKFRYWVAVDDDRGNDASWYHEQLASELSQTTDLAKAQLKVFQALVADQARQQNVCADEKVHVRPADVLQHGEQLSMSVRTGFHDRVMHTQCSM